MDVWKLWGSLISGFFVGFFYFVIAVSVYAFGFFLNLGDTFVVEFVFIVIVAIFSFWRIKSPKFGFIFGLVVPLVPEIVGILYGALPFGYLELFAYPEYVGYVFASLVIRFVGFPVAGFFGSYIWRIRKENF